MAVLVRSTVDRCRSHDWTWDVPGAVAVLAGRTAAAAIPASRRARHARPAGTAADDFALLAPPTLALDVLVEPVTESLDAPVAEPVTESLAQPVTEPVDLPAVGADSPDSGIDDEPAERVRLSLGEHALRAVLLVVIFLLTLPLAAWVALHVCLVIVGLIDLAADVMAWVA